MGALSDFLAGAFGNYGQQRAQMAADRRAEEADNRRFQKQLSYAKAAEAIKRNFEATSTPQIPQPYGLPIQRGPGNWEVPTRIIHPAMYDEQSGALTQPASVEEGPFMPAQDPNALTPYQQATIDQRDRAAQARIDAAAARRGSGSRAEVGEDGLTAYQRAQLEERRKNRERLERNSGKGGMTEKGWREGLDATLSSIQSAEPGKLKSIIRQYGGESIMTDNMDAETLREAAYSVAETYWNQRKPGKKSDDSASSDERDGGKAGSSKDNPADATSFSGEPPKGTWVRLPSGRVIQVR